MFNPVPRSGSQPSHSLIARIPSPIWSCSIAADARGSLDTSAGCSLSVHAMLTGSCGVADMVLSD